MRKLLRAGALLAASAGLMASAAATPATAQPGAGAPPVTYQMKSDQLNCLDVGPVTPPPAGKVVRTWSDCNHSTQQKWVFEKSGSTTWNIIHYSTGFCATLENDGKVRLRTCAPGTDGQDWKVDTVQDNKKKFQNTKNAGYLKDNGSPKDVSTEAAPGGSVWEITKS